MRGRIIPVGFNGSEEPIRRLLLLAEEKFGHPGKHTPLVDLRIARTEAQRLLDMSLGILGLAEEKLAIAYLRMCGRQISIQLQRALTGPDALRRSPGIHLDRAQKQMSSSSLGGHGQYFGERCFGGGQ